MNPENFIKQGMFGYIIPNEKFFCKKDLRIKIHIQDSGTSLLHDIYLHEKQWMGESYENSKKNWASQ